MIPVAKNISVGECPECSSPMFEEVQEFGDYHPDRESIFYAKILVCSGCNHTEDYEPPEPDYDDFEN